MRNHLCPIPSEVAEQHRFASRVQHEGENLMTFQAELRKLTTNCNFKCESCTKPTLNTHLRSQFIRGVRDSDIREKLLQLNSDVKFEDVVKQALSIESSKIESRAIQGTAQLFNMKTNRSTSNFRGERGENRKAPSYLQHLGKCFKCGSSSHKSDTCKAKNLRCTGCNQKNHVKAVCFKQKNHQIDQMDSIEESEEEFKSDEDENSSYNIINTVSEVNFLGSYKFLVVVEINKIPIKMEIDTGAALSTISKNNFLLNWSKVLLKTTNVKLQTYTGEIIVPYGVIRVQVCYNGKNIQKDLYIIDKNGDSILGRDWIRELPFDWTKINQIESFSHTSYDKKLNTLITKFEDVFDSKVGEVKNITLSLLNRN